jgi:hypothetical protein
MYHRSGLQPGVRVPPRGGRSENILWSTRKHIKTKHRNRLNLEPAMILALKKIGPRTDMLACQKQTQSYHQQVRTKLIIF